MFVDYIVIYNESRVQVEENLKSWSCALERRGIKVRTRETKKCVQLDYGGYRKSKEK